MEEKGVTPSICPKPDSPPYVAPFCVSSCDIDSDCDIGFKCCSVGCEKSCQRSGTSHFSHKKKFPTGKRGRLFTYNFHPISSRGGPAATPAKLKRERKEKREIGYPTLDHGGAPRGSLNIHRSVQISCGKGLQSSPHATSKSWGERNELFSLNDRQQHSRKKNYTIYI